MGGGLRFRTAAVIGLLLPGLVAGAAVAQESEPPGGAAPDTAGGEVVAAPAAPSVSTASDEAVSRLSPSLAALARTTGEGLAYVTVLQTGDAASPAPYLTQVAKSNVVNGFRWYSGFVHVRALPKVAALPGTLAVTQPGDRQPADLTDPLVRPNGGTPDRPPRTASPSGPSRREVLDRKLETARAERAAIEAGREQARQRNAERPPQRDPAAAGTKGVDAASIHGARAANARGWDGSGVVAAVVDSGVDFANPDLFGTQARIVGGPFAGWPASYNTMSGVSYVGSRNDPAASIGPDTYWTLPWNSTWYAHTLAVTGARCRAGVCTADLAVDVPRNVRVPASWPARSKSGRYRYTVHPDFDLLIATLVLGVGYNGAEPPLEQPPLVLVSDEATAGVYDTVYVDVDLDGDFGDEQPVRKGAEVTGLDLFNGRFEPVPDGKLDLSADLLTWISDGRNHPPGVKALYDVTGIKVPVAGGLLSFVGDFYGHGTSVASVIAAAGRMEDPLDLGPLNPAAKGGGSGTGAVLRGLAPDTRLSAYQGGYDLPFDAWTLAAHGFEGSTTRAQVVNNSWGDSRIVEDGWDDVSRFATSLSVSAPTTTFLAATGNGGPGYGTTAAPTGGTIIDVGASTSFGNLWPINEPSTLGQFTWGTVVNWSNRGPGATGDPSPDVVGVGAYGPAATPSNLGYFNGDVAYDLFGGTSMASPVAAGVLAVAVEAFRSRHGRFPTAVEAKVLLSSTADDLGLDPFTQGAGNLDADEAARAARGEGGRLVSPAQWRPGSYRGTLYPQFPAVLRAGEQVAQRFSVTNTSPVADRLAVRAVHHQRIGSSELTVKVPAGRARGWSRHLSQAVDITSRLPANSDLVRISARMPGSPAAVAVWEWIDLDTDRVQDFGELTLLDLNQSVGPVLEVTLSRDVLSRRRGRVFLDIVRVETGGEFTVAARISSFVERPWAWVTAPSSLSVGANRTAELTATLGVPAGTPPGSYQGTLELVGLSSTTVVPISLVVAASGDQFAFGAASLAEAEPLTALTNGHLRGTYDQWWRYETGEWRNVFYDVADGSSRPGANLVVDTEWQQAGTDVDTVVFGAAPPSWPPALRPLLGPTSLTRTGASTDTYEGGGVWRWGTNTGGPREVVAGALRDGLGLLSFHQVLTGGARFAETFAGSAYRVDLLPTAIEAVGARGSAQLTLTSTRALPGLSGAAVGLTAPQRYRNQVIRPDDDLCRPGYWKTVETRKAASLDITTTSAVAGLDIDLLLVGDADGNGVPNCDGDALVAFSSGPTADERITVEQPADGRYFVVVIGYRVPGGSATFDLTIDVTQGDDLRLTLPTGPVPANRPVTITVSWSKAGVAPGSVLQGVVWVGPKGAPRALRVPVTVTVR